MTNKWIARHLKQAADLLEVTGGNAYRARAFASAARTIDRMDEPAAALTADELTGLRGVGKGLAADIRGIVETGSFGLVESLLASLPPGLPGVMRVRGLGPKRVRQLWQELDVTDLDGLVAAAASGRLEALPGFGAKTVAKLLASVEELRAYLGRAHYAKALPEAEAAAEALRGAGLRAALAGALRRQCNTVDRAVIVAAGDAAATADALDAWGVAPGPGGALVGALPAGIELHVVLVDAARFGTELWARTGSDAHLDAFREAHGEPGDHADEDEVYRAAGLPPVPPPLREGLDELDLAARDALPTLVTVADLRGTLHNHSTWSDGAETLAEMAEAARARGLSYYGIGDHSRSLQIAHGLSLERLAEQVEEAAALNAAYAADGVGFRVLTGSECDILKDGTMDFPDSVLAGLDVVVASVHTHFGMTEAEATARLVRAVSNPHVDILGHATGRLLLRREGYPIDAEAVLAACAEHGTAVELNANPWRLDLDWRWLRRARELGVPVAINPDAHTVDGLDDVRWGVASAQKAGLEAADVLNTRPADALARG